MQPRPQVRECADRQIGVAHGHVGVGAAQQLLAGLEAVVGLQPLVPGQRRDDRGGRIDQRQGACAGDRQPVALRQAAQALTRAHQLRTQLVERGAHGRTGLDRAVEQLLLECAVGLHQRRRRADHPSGDRVDDVELLLDAQRRSAHAAVATASARKHSAASPRRRLSTRSSSATGARFCGARGSACGRDANRGSVAAARSTTVTASAVS